MQIYKEMNIGTAKPTKEEMQGIKHYLIDFVEPSERYSVADYKKDAKNAIKEIIAKRQNSNLRRRNRTLYRFTNIRNRLP